MTPLFTAATYTERRQKLAQAIGDGIILLPGNTDIGMNYADNVYHFCQDSCFRYFFGLDQPNLVGIIDASTGKSILFGDDTTLDMIIWTGPTDLLADLGTEIGVTDIRPYAAVADFLSNQTKTHYLPPYRGIQQVYLAEWLSISIQELGKGASQALIEAIIAQRSYKSVDELEQLHEAVQVTHDMHLAAMRSARPGMRESDVMAEAYRAALQADTHPSFPIILTKHGETLHNHHYHHTLADGDLVLCDAGGYSPMRYAGDMTRTFPAGKRFSQQQAEVYQIALDANMAAIQALKPGVPYRDIHLLSCRVITEGLQALGLMKGDTEASMAAGAHALFFPHGLGHMMGLDVHDMENLGEDRVGYTEKIRRSSQFGLRSLRLGRELEPGFVLTVEPGIYFIPALIDRWAQEAKWHEFVDFEALKVYRSFGGIRIEDDYVITTEGAELLGPPVPKTIAEVEAVRGESA
ncbi:MAG: aminopeptidase P family protein [Bacteroidota bacterium]